MAAEVIAEAVVEFYTRSPVVHVTAITGVLRINQELLATIWCRVNSGRALLTVRDGCVEFVTQAIVKYDPRRRFPGVFGIKFEGAATVGCRANVLSTGEV